MREVREEGRMMTSGVEVEELRREEWRGNKGKQKVIKKNWDWEAGERDMVCCSGKNGHW